MSDNNPKLNARRRRTVNIQSEVRNDTGKIKRTILTI